MGDSARRSMSGFDKFMLVVVIGGVLLCGGCVALFAFATTLPHDSTSTTIQASSPPSIPDEAAGRACTPAPQRIVAIINSAFTTDGEHIEDTQAVDGQHSMTYVGGNIVDASGEKESSQDTWVLFNGQVYSLTSDARRRTVLPDGRHLPELDLAWGDFNGKVGQCVGDVERARNQGR